jgi:hypothetical protein
MSTVRLGAAVAVILMAGCARWPGSIGPSHGCTARRAPNETNEVGSRDAGATCHASRSVQGCATSGSPYGGTSDAPKPPPRKAFLLRLPPDLLDGVRAWARDEMRSINAQIQFLLRKALEERRGTR